MTTSPKTIRLHNTCQMDLSLQLHRDSTRFNPRLRRGMHVTNVKIARGHVFDVCQELSVSLDEARRIVAHSPQVQARRRSRHLLIRDHPPSEANLAAEAKTTADRVASETATAALNPPDAPDALPAGVNPQAVGLPASTPRQVHPPTSAASLLSVAASEPEPEDEDEPEAPEPEEEATPVAPVARDTPSMEWSLRRLKRYANDHAINLDGARSKTVVLKTIKDAVDGDA